MNYKVSVARLVTGTFSLHDSENRIKKMLVGKQNPFFLANIKDSYYICDTKILAVSTGSGNSSN